MKHGDTVTVKKDEKVISHSTRKVLCNGGDNLKVISVHVDVLIVEFKNNRFSIHIDKIETK